MMNACKTILVTALALAGGWTVHAADFNVKDYGGSVAQAAEAAGRVASD